MTRENSIGERRNALRSGAPSCAVVVLAAVLAAPEERAERAAAVVELGGDDGARADRLAVDVARFVDDGEAVAAPQVVIEIDVAGEDVGQLQRHGVGQSRRVGGGEQRRADLAGRHLPADFRRRRPRIRAVSASPSRAIDSRWPSPVRKRRLMSRPSSSVSTVSGFPGRS